MRRAYCLIRDQPHYRHDAFVRGLQRIDFEVVRTPPLEYRARDVLVIWNRYWENHEFAKRMEAAGGTVLVAENGYLGVGWNGARWYALSRSHHNGAGTWSPGPASRWDDLQVQLEPWREGGSEVVILPQRGIGPPGVAMPAGWECAAQDQLQRTCRYPVRIRPHPGNGEGSPFAEDLARARAVVTWGSTAALRALLLGIPAFYAMPGWIGARAGAPLEKADFKRPRRGQRLAMFRRLAWAMWRIEEIEAGTPFRRLLQVA